MARLGLVDKLGEPVSRATWHRALRSPFCTGMFVYGGDLHEGKHEALVSRSVFAPAQRVIARRPKPRAPKLKSFLYRGVFHCGEFGCFITTETQKGNNYLRCTERVKLECTQPSIRESLVAAHRPLAVVTADEVTLRKGNGDGFAAQIAELLTPGVECTILEERPDWLRVRLQDGTEGWLRTNAVERV